MIDFLVYDVFTDTPFTGNPLAIVPDAKNLADPDLQRIAREFNFSETTFVYPPSDPSHDAMVRIFTPTQEIPFAGHPTVGTAIALADLGLVGTEVTLELGVGPIAVTLHDGEAQFVTRTPLTTWPGPSAATVAASASIESHQVRVDRHTPVIASVGLPFAIAELPDLETLASVTPNTDAFRAFEPSWPTETHYDLLVYVRDGHNIKMRMFAPLDGIPEDPATGSAAAALVAFLGQLDGRSGRFEIAQGVEMGRPSRIVAEVEVDDGVPVSVAVSGKAVKVMEGRLTL